MNIGEPIRTVIVTPVEEPFQVPREVETELPDPATVETPAEVEVPA